MKTELWLIRHGESTANAGARGETPSGTPLTDTGKMQAKRVAAYLGDFPRPDRVIVSPFLRTQETAAPFLESLEISAAEEWAVQEWIFLNPAKYAGTTNLERQADVQAYRERADPNFHDGGTAETFSTFMTRVGFCFELARVWGGVSTVFTHGRFIQGALWWLDNVQPKTINLLADVTTPWIWPYLFNSQDFQEFWAFSDRTPIENCQIVKIGYNEGQGWDRLV